jgi:hypothetical protein
VILDTIVALDTIAAFTIPLAAQLTYSVPVWSKERLWKFSALQRAHISNLVSTGDGVVSQVVSHVMLEMCCVRRFPNKQAFRTGVAFAVPSFALLTSSAVMWRKERLRKCLCCQGRTFPILLTAAVAAVIASRVCPKCATFGDP